MAAKIGGGIVAGTGAGPSGSMGGIFSALRKFAERKSPPLFIYSLHNHFTHHEAYSYLGLLAT